MNLARLISTQKRKKGGGYLRNKREREKSPPHIERYKAKLNDPII